MDGGGFQIPGPETLRRGSVQYGIKRFFLTVGSLEASPGLVDRTLSLQRYETVIIM